MSPLFTIGIPTYNRATWLKDAITSVLQQTYQDFELIIGDNASTDNTPEVVKGFNDPRIRYYRWDRNLGPEANISWTIEKAVGTYFVLLQDDDLLFPIFLSRVAKAFSSTEKAVLYGSSIFVTSNRNCLMNSIVHTPPVHFDLSNLLNNNQIHINGRIIATSFLLFTGLIFPAVAIKLKYLKQLIPFNSENIYCGDRILLAEIACKGDVIIDPMPLAIRFLHKGAAVNRYLSDFSKRYYLIRQATNKIINIMESYSIDWEEYLSQILKEAPLNQVRNWMEGIVVKYNYPKSIVRIFIDEISRRTGCSPRVKKAKVKVKTTFSVLKYYLHVVLCSKLYLTRFIGLRRHHRP